MVLNDNDAPTLSNAIADTTAIEAHAFSYILPVNTFSDVDMGDTLTYTVTQADGSALPAWLSFNPSTYTFSGTPNMSGTLSIKIAAKDTGNLTISDVFNISIASFDQTINGTTLAETLNGGTGNDTINGYAENDLLNGYAGNDILDGGADNDTMIGGLGNDTYTLDVATDVITENLNEGIDVVNVAVTTAGGTYTLAANVENATLTNTVAYSFTGNVLDNVLTGNAAANTLNGGAGNDTLNGLAGNDTMIGGAGNDSYTIDVLTDVITENLNEGTDLVDVAVTTAGGTYTLAANVENATLTNTVAYSLTGNALNNVLTGNSAANILDGGAGVDTLIGDLGNDTYTIDTLMDVITENLNEGTDRVNSSIAFSIATFANVENLTLTGTSAINATGNALDNVLTGNTGNNSISGGAGNDTLDGGTDNDTMVGGIGNDVYFVNVATDVVTELANEGAGTINSAVTLSIAILTNIENITLRR